MLHILLVILKILGILLLSLFTLAVVLLVLILFAPVRYLAQGEYRGEVKARGWLHWLFPLVSISFQIQGKQMEMKLRILGIPVKRMAGGGEDEEAEGAPGGKPSGGDAGASAPGGKPSGADEEASAPGGKPSGADEEASAPGGKPSGAGEEASAPGGKLSGEDEEASAPGGKLSGEDEEASAPGGKPSGADEEASAPGGKPNGEGEAEGHRQQWDGSEAGKEERQRQENQADQGQAAAQGQGEVQNQAAGQGSAPGKEGQGASEAEKAAMPGGSRRKKSFRGFLAYLRRLWRKVAASIQKLAAFLMGLPGRLRSLKDGLLHKAAGIRDTVSGLAERGSEVLDFLRDETTVGAIRVLLSALKGLLRHLKPKKLRLWLHYGTGDPYTLGQHLIGLSFLYGLCGEWIEIQPDWEEKVLEAEGMIKGRLRVFTLLRICIKVLRDKNAKETWRRLQEYKNSKENKQKAA